MIGAGPEAGISVGHIWAMVAHAGLLVKLVMLVLLGFSVVSWAIIISKYIQVRRARRSSFYFLELFWNSRSLTGVHNELDQFEGSPIAGIFRVGYQELNRLRRSPRDKGSGADDSRGEAMLNHAVETVSRSLRRGISVETTRLVRHLSFLATTGNTTPFIGLFGTVWGIMTSFQQIGLSGAANLAVVAPGISEALIATAAGLAAAIPAVVAYNYFNSQVTVLETEMRNFASDFLNMIEREMVRKAGSGD